MTYTGFGVRWQTTFISNGLILGAGLVSGVLTARFLGVEERGLLAAIIYWPHFLTGMITLGLNEAIVVRVARTGDHRELIPTVMLLSLGLAGIVIVLGGALMPWLLGQGRAEHVRFASYYLALFAPASLLAMNMLAILHGRMEFGAFNLQRIAQAALYPVMLVGLWLANLLDVATAALAMLTGTVLIAMLRVWAVRSLWALMPSRSTALDLLGMGLRIHAVDMLTHLSTQLDKMALVLFSNNTALGLYVAAQTLAYAGQSLLSQTFANIALPSAAHDADLDAITTPLRRILLASILITATLLLVLPWLLPFLFGEDFAAATGVAQILAVAGTLAALKKALLYVLRARSSHRASSLAEAIAVLVMLVGAFPAIHWFDAVGLALLVAVAQACSLVVIWFGFASATKLNVRRILGLGVVHA